MNIGQLGAGDFTRRLSGAGLSFRTGPFTVRIRSDAPVVHDGVRLLYADHPMVDEAAFCDFVIELRRPASLRRWVRPQVCFTYDGARAFEPLPMGHAFALLEWAMNWCISTHAHRFLMLHAAVIERDGLAVVLPAPPGSGKSTLCAGLIHRGWRLLSDEMALIAPETGLLHGLARPVSLKNESLAVMRQFEPRVVFNEPAHDTAKGTVAHMKVPLQHVLRVADTAKPGWVVFPRYRAQAPATLTPLSKPETMMALIDNSFNYSVLGLAGFETLASLVDASECHDFEYSRLKDAVEVFDALVRARA